jgi:hypothetical protein
MVPSHQEKDRHAGAFRQSPFSCDIFLADALGLCSDSPNRMSSVVSGDAWVARLSAWRLEKNAGRIQNECP